MAADVSPETFQEGVVGGIPWMRILKVTLYGDKVNSDGTRSAVVLGNADSAGEIQKIELADGSVIEVPAYGLTMNISGSKYLSTMQDNFVITIYNLDPMTIYELVNKGYLNVKIEVGYRSIVNDNGEPILTTIFKGGVAYISSDTSDIKTQTTYIVCTNQMIAKYSQTRLNLSFRSGMNIYTMMKFIARRAGLGSIYVSEELKGQNLYEDMMTENALPQLIDRVIDDSLNDEFGTANVYAAMGDSSWDTGEDGCSALSVLDISRVPLRTLNISADSGLLINGPCNVTSDGVKFDALCTFLLMPGDQLHIGGSLLNFYFRNQNEMLQSNSITSQIDKKGDYIVFQIDYSLSNADGQCKQSVHCKSKSLIQNGGLLSANEKGE